MKKPFHVLIDCERMKYPFTGLYYYCLYLGKALMNNRNVAERLSFYVPASEKNVFGTERSYVIQNSLDKFLLPPTKSFSVWHSTYQGTNYYPWKRGLKVLFTVHDLNFMHSVSKPAFKKNKYLDSLKRKVERADHIVAISQFTLNDLKKHIDISGKPCSVIYNGCNIVEMAQLDAPANRPNAPFFFTIGTIVEKKNFHVLPPLLINNNYKLVIAGITQDEKYKQAIIDEAKKLGVEGRLVFIGSISENDKQWYLRNCTAFVFPSISEGFGLPVIEAMYFGKPVLLSASTSLPEIGGSEAYYFTSFEPDEMNKVATIALEEYDDAKAQRIQQWANQFNWNVAARQYLDLYSKLAE